MYSKGVARERGRASLSPCINCRYTGSPADMRVLALICGSPSLNAPSEGIQIIGMPQGSGERVTSEATRRNSSLWAVGSADNVTGYVFGVHLNHDPFLDPVDIERDALECGDYRVTQPFRKHARLWVKEEYLESVKRSQRIISGTVVSLADDINTRYTQALQRATSKLLMSLPAISFSLSGECRCTPPIQSTLTFSSCEDSLRPPRRHGSFWIRTLE